MRRGFVWMAVGGLLWGGLAGCPRPAPEGGPGRAAESGQRYAGSLQETAEAGGRPLLVVWNGALGTRVFWVSPETAFSRNGRPAGLGDLRVGDLVEIRTVPGSDVAAEVVCRTP